LFILKFEFIKPNRAGLLLAIAYQKLAEQSRMASFCFAERTLWPGTPFRQLVQLRRTKEGTLLQAKLPERSSGNPRRGHFCTQNLRFCEQKWHQV